MPSSMIMIIIQRSPSSVMVVNLIVVWNTMSSNSIAIQNIMRGDIIIQSAPSTICFGFDFLRRSLFTGESIIWVRYLDNNSLQRCYGSIRWMAISFGNYTFIIPVHTIQKTEVDHELCITYQEAQSLVIFVLDNTLLLMPSFAFLFGPLML